MSISQKYKIVASVLFGILWAYSSPGWSQSSAEFVLEYLVKVKGRNAGTATFTLRREGNSYNLSSVVTPNKTAKLLGARQSDESLDFTPSKDGWTLQRYHQERRGRKAGITEVLPEQGRYALRLDGKVQLRINEALIEPETFPIASLMLDNSQLAGKQVWLVRRGGFRTHNYQMVGPETIDVNGVPVNTTRWKRLDGVKTKNWFNLWIDNSNRQPVKMQRVKGGSKTTTLTLMP